MMGGAFLRRLLLSVEVEESGAMWIWMVLLMVWLDAVMALYVFLVSSDALAARKRES